MTLEQTIEREYPILLAMTAERAAVHPAGAESWSPKQELGHLIDSAANNHIRFVRAALEPEFRGPGYAQNDWVDLHGYQEMPWQSIVTNTATNNSWQLTDTTAIGIPIRFYRVASP